MSANHKTLQCGTCEHVQGFDNVNALLALTEGPAASYTAASLVAVVAAKIAATATARASGLVGGVYAPAIFIGAAIGSGFWLAIVDTGATGVTGSEVYALVGAAAMLAAFCRVPLTSVLLLFELTQDYSIVLPALAAVGLARWSSTVGNRAMRSRG